MTPHPEASTEPEDLFERSRRRDPDPFRRHFQLPLRETFHPHGFPLEIATNSQDVMGAAREGWGAFAKLFAEKPLRLRIAVTEQETRGELRVPLIRAQRHLFAKVGSLNDFLVCDTREGFGFCWLS